MDHREGLKRLIKTDLARHKARVALDGLATANAENEAGITKLRALLPKVSAGVAAAGQVVQQREADVAALQEKLAKLDKRLKAASSAKAANAVQTEITAMREKIAGAEEVVLEAMEAEEAAQAMVDKVTGGIATLEEKIAQTAAAVPGRRAELEAELAGHDEDRARWRKNIGEADLEYYDALAAKKPGKKIVVAIDSSCVACDRSFTPSDREGFMRNAEVVHRCPKCGAMMIFEGAISL